jgi:hypothetical protein
MVHLTARYSRLALLALFATLLVVRTVKLTPNELSWDVFGYYLPLPATFVHHDPLLHDISWMTQMQEQYGTTATLYQVTQAPDGSPMYFFLLGMSLLYLPSFLLGHATAFATGAPMDGFSLPYQYAMALGCMLYTLIGLVYFRRTLLQFFPDRTVAVLLVLVGFGTNYFHFTTVKDLETANFLFFGMAVLVWNTIRWHAEHKRRNLLAIAASVAMITLVKPSEIICGLIPLFWGVFDRTSWNTRITLLRTHGKDVALAVLLGLLVLSPQLVYWKMKTGSFIFDSYKNPGVGLDLWSPHIGPILFSLKKGWLVYTPIMVFALLGFVQLWQRKRELFPVILGYFLITFYIIASWSEWWYGASYSIRPMITSYVLLAIPLGYFLQRMSEWKALWRWSASSLMGCFVVLNLFQIWQLNHFILDPYRTTPAYYLAIFGKTSVTEEDRKLMSVEPDFSGALKLTDPTGYRQRNIGHYDFEEPLTGHRGALVRDSLHHGSAYAMDSTNQFSPNVETTFEGITTEDHAWIRARVDVKLPAGYAEETPCLVVTMARKEGNYGYRTACADTAPAGQWVTLSMDYLTPNIRDPRDRVQVYVWHRGRTPVLIDDLNVEVFTPQR